MTRFFRRTRSVWLVSGVFAAALIGGLVSGILTHGLNSGAADDSLTQGFFRAINAHATATNSSESLLIATGEIDIALEGVFTLDPLTGELRGAVLNPGKAGAFAATYSSDISNDFGSALKNPKFLMVTGVIDMRQGSRANARLARGVIYVAEAASGKVNIYGIPWDAAKANIPGGINKVAFVPLGTFQARDVAAR